MKNSLLALAGALALALPALGAPTNAVVISTSFDQNPLQRGWKTYGNSNLFVWDSTGKALDVTWDSSNTNSYYYYPLRTVLTRQDDFTMQFDWTILDVSGDFELALGFINLASATSPNFFRGTGSDSPNLAEFTYFPPADGWPGSVLESFAATNNWNTPWDSPFSTGFHYQNLPLNTPMRVVFDYVGSNSTASLLITSEGQELHSSSFTLDSGFTDYRCDAFAVDCYSDYNGFGYQVLAHGVITNITLKVPLAPVENIRAFATNGQWTVQCDTRTNWIYTLERSADLSAWSATAATTTGTGATMELTDPAPSSGAQFYRVGARRAD